MPIFLLFLIVSETIQIRALSKLVSVVQIFRHGQRTPIKFYPNDPYSDPAYWPVELEELTNTGKNQQNALGKYTRERYIDTLPASYSRKAIYVQTTDVDRTHMSAQCNLLGLFPPTSNELWNPDVAWSPIPVHLSRVLAMFPSSCPAFDKERTRVLSEEPYYQNISATYAETYEYLTKNSGSNVTTLTDILFIYDTLFIEDEFGFSLPSWTEAVFPEPLTTLVGFFYQSSGFTRKLSRFGTGIFLKEVVDHFEKMKEDSRSAQFFRMYSAHDFNIVGVLSALGSFKPHVPYYGSSIYFELWNSSGTYFVNIYYRNKDVLEKITPLGCMEFDCKLSDLKQQLSDILPDIATWAAECAA